MAYDIFNVEELRTKVDQAITKFNIQGAIELVFEQLRFVNNWIAEKAPWKMKAAEQKDEKQSKPCHLLSPLPSSSCVVVDTTCATLFCFPCPTHDRPDRFGRLKLSLSVPKQCTYDFFRGY